MKALTIYLLISMLAGAFGETEIASSNAQTLSKDYAYPNTALRYLGLGDYPKQHSVSSNDPVTYTAPDQQGYVKYITYTSDGSNVYQVSVRVKPGTYPVIWSTPVQSEPSATDGKSSGDNGAGNGAADLQPSLTKIDSHPSEDALPMTLPSHPEGHEVPVMTTCHYDNSNEEGTERPATAESQVGNTEGDSGKKEDSIKAFSGGSQLKDYAFAQGVRAVLPQYFPSLYGAMSYYPVAYNPYTGQRQYIAQPVGPLASAMLPSASPTVVTKGDKAGQATTTTLNPNSMASTTRPSSIPMGITTSGTPVRVQPISYIYPYMSYQSKNSGVIYQVPAQQIGASSPQVIRWVQAAPQPATRYQAAYSPQGYMSYQPAVLSLQSAMPPPSQNTQPMMSGLQGMATKLSLDSTGQQ